MKIKVGTRIKIKSTTAAYRKLYSFDFSTHDVMAILGKCGRVTAHTYYMGRPAYHIAFQSARLNKKFGDTLGVGAGCWFPRSICEVL